MFWIESHLVFFFNDNENSEFSDSYVFKVNFDVFFCIDDNESNCLEKKLKKKLKFRLRNKIQSEKCVCEWLLLYFTRRTYFILFVACNGRLGLGPDGFRTLRGISEANITSCFSPRTVSERHQETCV